MKLALVGLGYWGGKVLRNMVDDARRRRASSPSTRPSALVDWAASELPGADLPSSLRGRRSTIPTSTASSSPRRSPATPR